MKNANIMGIHQFLGERGHKKTKCMGNHQKRGAWTICRGTWQEIRRRVFLKVVVGEGGGWSYLDAHYDLILVHVGT